MPPTLSLAVTPVSDVRLLSLIKRSKDVSYTKALEGVDGYRAYLLVADHYSGKLWGVCADSKGKYVFTDRSSNLGRNHELITLLEKYDYIIRSTAPDLSHQNAGGEQPHQTIVNSLR
eukprot:15355499-Ditylum_brightwellii.AAC.1